MSLILQEQSPTELSIGLMESVQIMRSGHKEIEYKMCQGREETNSLDMEAVLTVLTKMSKLTEDFAQKEKMGINPIAVVDIRGESLMISSHDADKW